MLNDDDRQYYQSLQEFSKQVPAFYFIKQLKRVECWFKVEDGNNVKHIVQKVDYFKGKQEFEQYYIAFKCWSQHYGDFWLLVSEIVWYRAIRKAKNEDGSFHPVGRGNPWIHAFINRQTKHDYKITVYESFRTEQEWNEKMQQKKQYVF